MAANYDITLRLHAQLEGLGPQLGNLQRQIQGAGGAINLNTTAAQAGVSRLTSGLQASQLALRQVQSAAAATNPALQATANVTGSLSFQLANFRDSGRARRPAGHCVLAGRGRHLQAGPGHPGGRLGRGRLRPVDEQGVASL
jgi:hypothetical protein